MPTALYLPRRHRRHLLFPPGLLALAGLLWLGCVTVTTIKPYEPPKSFAVLVPRPLATGLYSNLVERQSWGLPSSITFTKPDLFIPSDSWFTYFFGQQTRFILPDNQQEKSTWQGVAFRFDGVLNPEVAEARLAVLERQSDLLYWFANTPAVGVVYAARFPPPGPVECVGFMQPAREYPSTLPPCLLCGDVMSPQEPLTLASVKEKTLSEIRLLLSPDWRTPMLLLLLLAALSAWKLQRLQAAYRH